MTEPTILANRAYDQFVGDIMALSVSERITAVEELTTCLDVYKDELLDEQRATAERAR